MSLTPAAVIGLLEALHTDGHKEFPHETQLFIIMYHPPPHLFDKANIAKQNFSHRSNVICDGSPSRIRMVRRISLGITTRPRSSMRRMIPVAFIYKNSLLHIIVRLLFVKSSVLCRKGQFFPQVTGRIFTLILPEFHGALPTGFCFFQSNHPFSVIRKEYILELLFSVCTTM